MIPIHCSLGCPKKRRHQRHNHTSSPNRIPTRHAINPYLDLGRPTYVCPPYSCIRIIISVASTSGTVSTLHHAPRAPTAHSCCPMCHFPSFCWQVRDDTLLKINVPSMVHCYLLSILWLWFSKAPSRIKLEPHTWPPPC
jgi:hypothetical protein